jgi:hypothetical protein
VIPLRFASLKHIYLSNINEWRESQSRCAAQRSSITSAPIGCIRRIPAHRFGGEPRDIERAGQIDVDRGAKLPLRSSIAENESHAVFQSGTP